MSDTESLTCACGRVTRTRNGLRLHQRTCTRSQLPPTIKPLAITVSRSPANDPAIEARIAEIAAREAGRFRPLPSATTTLDPTLKPHERAARQHGGTPKVGR